MHDIATMRRTLGASVLGLVLTFTVISLGAYVTQSPAPVIAVAIGILGLTALSMSPQAIFPALIILAFTSVPVGIPTAFSISGIQFRIYEPVLLIAAIIAVVKYRAPEYRVPGAVAIGSVLLGGALLGLVSPNPDIRVMTDVRPLVSFYLAYLIAAKMIRTGQFQSLLRVVPFVLWVSAATTTAASMFGFNIANMQAEAAGSTDAAARLIGPATYLAVAVLCGLIALYIAGKIRLRNFWMYWVPALPLITLTFSRNILIALGAATVFAVLASLSTPAIVRTLRLILGVAVVAFLSYAMTSILAGWPGTTWLRAQFDGYLDRVVGGIGSDAIARDGSAQFRVEQENAYLIPEIEQRPFWGNGFGYAYKPLNTGRSISEKSEYLRYYAHNFYLWLLVKVGLVGSFLFFFPVFSGLVGAIRRKGSVAIATGAATVGFLGISVVAPMPLGNPTSVVFGIAAGACVASVSYRKRRKEQETNRPYTPNTEKAMVSSYVKG